MDDRWTDRRPVGMLYLRKSIPYWRHSWRRVFLCMSELPWTGSFNSMRLKDLSKQIPPILEAYAYRTRGDHAPDELSLRIDCRMVLAVALRYQGGSLLPGSSFCKSPIFRYKGGDLLNWNHRIHILRHGVSTETQFFTQGFLNRAVWLQLFRFDTL